MEYKKKELDNGCWEYQYHPSLKKDSKDHLGAQFSPMRSKDRMTTYIKVNETDH